MIDRTIAPITGSFPEKINIQKAEFHKLKNGIPLFLLVAGKQAVAKVEVIFTHGGNVYEEYPGQSFFANKLLNSGTSQKNSGEISEALAEYGASLEIQPSFDSSSISIVCLEKHLNDVLPIFLSIVNSPIYPEEELTREKELQVNNLRVQETKTNVKASKIFRNVIFPKGHPYGNILAVDNINSLTRDQLVAFHKAQMSNYTVLISGYFSDQSLSNITSSLEAIQVKPSIIPQEIIQSNPEKPSRHRLPMMNTVQCSLRIGKRIVGKSHPDYIQNFVTNHILGGYFGSRLMKNVREEKGLTYGIYSSIVNFQNASYFVISADVKQDVVEEAIREIHHELTTLSTSIISKEELNTVKSHMIGSLQSDLNSAFSLGTKFKNIHMYGLGYDYYDQYLDTIKNITPEQILASAQQYFKVNEMIEVITGAVK